MKIKLISLLLIIGSLSSIYANSPLDSTKIDFKISEPGILTCRNSTSNYYVLEYQGKSASELYTNVLSAISSIYNNPEKVLSKVDNVSITISAYAEVITPNVNIDFVNIYHYNLQFLFKDNKIRINAPSFDSENILNYLFGEYNKVAPLFSMHFNGSDDEFAKSLQTYLNSLIINIIQKSETINNW